MYLLQDFELDGVFQELRHSFNITNLSASAFPAQEVPLLSQHAVPLAHDLTNLSRVLLQALAHALGTFIITDCALLDFTITLNSHTLH